MDINRDRDYSEKLILIITAYSLLFTYPLRSQQTFDEILLNCSLHWQSAGPALLWGIAQGSWVQPRMKQKKKGRINVIKDILDIEEHQEPAKKNLRLKQESQTRHEVVIARIHRIRHSISASTL